MQTVIKPVLDGRYFIKWLHAGYLDAVASIECDSCENFMTKEIVGDLMDRNWIDGLIITDLKLPVGYVIWERIPSRKTISIINLVVRDDYRRKGLGTELLRKATNKFKKSGFRRGKFRSITCCIRESNCSGRMFLTSRGFSCSGLLRDHFEDHYYDRVEREDAFCFYLTASMASAMAQFKEEQDVQNDNCNNRPNGASVLHRNVTGAE
jgi:ribosomal protein S18 acetylase RimI-like enzyme